MISALRSRSPDMARISGFSRGSIGEPSAGAGTWSVGTRPDRLDVVVESVQPPGRRVEDVIRPSASQATMPSSRVSSSTRRNSSSWRSA